MVYPTNDECNDVVSNGRIDILDALNNTGTLEEAAKHLVDLVEKTRMASWRDEADLLMHSFIHIRMSEEYWCSYLSPRWTVSCYISGLVAMLDDNVRRATSTSTYIFILIVDTTVEQTVREVPHLYKVVVFNHATLHMRSPVYS